MSRYVYQLCHLAAVQQPQPYYHTSALRRLCCLLVLLPCPCMHRYVKKPYDKAGTELKVVVRGKENSATVTKMPFVKTTYYRG